LALLHRGFDWLKNRACTGARNELSFYRLRFCFTHLGKIYPKPCL
uniref:IS5/IS1182 family transposase n=1 Tax=Angiostrongylus cantonensis TaxID=6313 RepID=A0A0K0DG75_ANGCA